jgi:hypothetical protein
MIEICGRHGVTPFTDLPVPSGNEIGTVPVHGPISGVSGNEETARAHEQTRVVRARHLSRIEPFT